MTELTTYEGYSVGDLVQLRGDPEEDVPRERAVIDGIDQLSWGVCFTATVISEDREPGDRDGLREFKVDQIEGLA